MKFMAYLGGPGTGKTTILKKMASENECHIICQNWYAASSVGGQTIYSYCNCSYKKFRPVKFVRKIVLIDEIF